ncbi:calponin homology domain-containing protein [Gorgonomyces haynaldii]|nr:calponin homology domain-containing protein [Gorgonomyces haynaldii]
MKPEFNSLDKDLELKKQAKYDPERERQALDWVKQVSGMPLDGDFYTALKDGQALCMAINKILPEKPIKISNSKMAFKQMENIHAFLEKIRVLGVPSFESFQTIDLFEAKNLIQVTDCIFSVSRNAEKRGWQGPRLGPKLADKNERQFTEEQLLQAKMAVPLLQSYTKGASQAGMGGRFVDCSVWRSPRDWWSVC